MVCKGILKTACWATATLAFGMRSAAAGTPPAEIPPPLAQHSTVVPQVDLPHDATSQLIVPDRYARPTLHVQIGEHGPFNFLVDTGAQATVIGSDLARRLALPPAGRAILVATGSRQAVDLVQVNRLAFADREVRLPAIPVLETRHLGADGILGLDALQGLRVLIDFDQQRIHLADPRMEQVAGRYEIVVRARKRLGQMIIADAKVDGVRTNVVIDTGADISIGNAALLRRLRSREREPTTGMDVHGTTFAADMRLADQVVIGTMVIDQVPIGFTRSPAFAALGLEGRPALILGMSALRALDRLAIDFASRRVMFDLPRSKTRAGSKWSSRPTF